MEPKTAKSTLIYNNLRGRILNGQLPPGSRLPSAHMLCEEYRVGLYTAKQVIARLRQDGLIETAPRRASIVRRAPEQPPPRPDDELRSILARRTSILGVYRTFALLLPGMLTFATQAGTLDLTPHYTQLRGMLRRGEGDWHTVSDFVRDILQSGENLLFGELYAFFELNGCLSYFMERCPWFRSYFIGPQPEPLPGLLEILEEPDSARKYERLDGLYSGLYVAVSAVLTRMAQEAAEETAEVETDFTWEPLCGKKPYYARIALDLAQRIGAGQYTPGVFLPPEAKLAAQYGVTVTTVRRALEMTGRRGFTRTVNGRGTLVLSPDRLDRAPQLLSDPAARQDALTCLHALQLLTLLADGVAREAALFFTERDMNELETALSAPDRILSLEVLYLALLRRLTLEPLRTLLDGTVQLARWAYYFSNSLQAEGARDWLDGLVTAALQPLREKEAEAFAQAMGRCCRYVLDSVREYMVNEYDLQAGNNIRSPLPPVAY